MQSIVFEFGVVYVILIKYLHAIVS